MNSSSVSQSLIFLSLDTHNDKINFLTDPATFRPRNPLGQPTGKNNAEAPQNHCDIHPENALKRIR